MRNEEFRFGHGNLLVPIVECAQCNTFIGVAVGAATVGLGVYSAVSGSGQPQYQSQESEMQALEDQNAAELPSWLKEEAQAQLGQNASKTTTNPAYTSLQNQIAQLQQQIKQSVGTAQNYTDQIQLGNLQKQLSATAPTLTSGNNFTGMGTAAIEGAQAQQSAQAQLAQAKQFDPQYIAQALSEENQANPQGVAARAQETKMIQDEVAHPLTDPVANTLNQQVSQQLTAAANNEMTPQEEAQFGTSVNSALASRGSGGGSTATYEQPLVTGAGGVARQQAAAQEGTGWLSSGQTPADFQYRQSQQAMSDLSSLVNGATPESQFKELSGAQTGPTAGQSTATLSQMPNNASGAIQSGITSTNEQMSNALQQANPWTVGLSSAMNLGAAIGKLGAGGGAL